jgi:tRNA dimethylallyltransferase
MNTLSCEAGAFVLRFGMSTTRPAIHNPLATILLAGPTATGKTALAVELARRLSGEIVSADSMQVYRGFAIGTAQPTNEELRGTVCHLAGCIEPDRAWNAADWRRAALERVADIQARGKRPIVVGGTGLYFKVLTQGMFEAPGARRAPEIRRRLETEWDSDGGENLRRRLAAADPETSRRVHPNDRLRVVRALEVYESTHLPISRLHAEGRRERVALGAHRFVLTAPREDLYRRIDRRVEEMVAKGFVDEVRALCAAGLREGWPAMKALGYAQMLGVVRGTREIEDAVAETQLSSRQYAKRQMVLFRQWPGSIWLDASRDAEKTLRAIEIALEFPPFSGF